MPLNTIKPSQAKPNQTKYNIHHTLPVFGYPQKFLFLILNVLFLIKQVNHHNGFINYT